MFKGVFLFKISCHQNEPVDQCLIGLNLEADQYLGNLSTLKPFPLSYYPCAQSSFFFGSL